MDSFLFSLIYFFIFCIIPTAFVILIIVLIIRSSNRDSKTVSFNNSGAEIKSEHSSTNNSILTWLLQQKSQGIQTIDQLISIAKGDVKSNPQINSKDLSNSSRDQVVFAKPKTAKAVYITPKAPSKPINNAEILLYIGSFLVVFSLFLLIAFTWEVFNGYVKAFILIMTTLGFYVVGIALLRIEKLKSAGYTFLTIASVGLVFTGIGLWNFVLKEVFDEVMFYQFWVFYSIFVLIVLAATYYFLKLKRFFYIALIVLYTLATAFAFTVSADYKFRIVIFALINFIFYISQSAFKKFSTEVRVISRGLNILLDIIIFLIVLSLVSTSLITGNFDKTVSIIALIIPLAFTITVYFREKARYELFIFGLGLTLFKVLIITLIFKLSTGEILAILTAYTAIITAIAEYLFHKDRILYIGTRIISLTSIFFISLYLLLQWPLSISPNLISNLKIDSALQIIILALSFGVIAVPAIFRKRIFELSITIFYIAFAVLRIFGIIKPDAVTIEYVIIEMALLIIASAGLIFGKAWRSAYNNTAIYAPTVSLLMLLSGFSVLTTSDNIAIAFIYIIFTAICYVLAFNRGWHILRVLGIGFVIVIMIALFRKVYPVSFDGMQNIGAFWILTAGFLYFIEEILTNKFKLNNNPAFGGFRVFNTLALMWLFVTNPEVSITILLIQIIYAVYYIYARNYLRIGYLLYGLIVLLIIKTAYFAVGQSKVDTELILLFVISGFSLVTNLFTNNILELSYREPLQRLKSSFQNSSIIVALFVIAISFFLIWSDSVYSILGLILAGTSLLIVNKNSLSEFLRLYGLFGFLTAFWTIAQMNSLSADWYIGATTAYLLLLAYIYNREGKRGTRNLLEATAYIFQGSVLLLQSLIFETEVTRIVYGLILISLSVALILFGLYRKNRTIIYIGATFLILELLARLFFIIVLIPWWIYIGVFGIFILGVGIYVLSKSKS